MLITHRISLSGLVVLILLLAACGPTATPVKEQQTVTISKSFQSQLSPVPTPSTYRCGAWSSNNTPRPYSTIFIYARITKNIVGVGGATATGTVHFQDFDFTFDQHPQSDSGGYVTFPLSLGGREPINIPATVDVTFSNFPGGTVHCTPAFFTPI